MPVLEEDDCTTYWLCLRSLDAYKAVVGPRTKMVFGAEFVSSHLTDECIRWGVKEAFRLRDNRPLKHHIFGLQPKMNAMGRILKPAHRR